MKTPRRFGVFDAQLSGEDLRRENIRDLAHRLREGTTKPTDLQNAAFKLEQLAEYPDMLAVLGERRRAPDVYHWLAYHALLCERLGGGTYQRVADFWSRSSETVQDALTDRRAGLRDSINAEIDDWLAQGFSPAEILDSLEGTRLSSMRDFIQGRKRANKSKGRKK